MFFRGEYTTQDIDGENDTQEQGGGSLSKRIDQKADVEAKLRGVTYAYSN